MEVRINRYLSEAGLCSRRAADKLIEEGKIYIAAEIENAGSEMKIDTATGKVKNGDSEVGTFAFEITNSVKYYNGTVLQGYSGDIKSSMTSDAVVNRFSRMQLFGSLRTVKEFVLGKYIQVETSGLDFA